MVVLKTLQKLIVLHMFVVRYCLPNFLKADVLHLHDVILGTVLEVAMLLFGTMLFIVLFHLSPASGDGLAVAPFVVI